MSVIQTLKETIGIADTPEYHCQSCDHTFQTKADVDSHWFSCPECEGEDIERVTEN